MFFLNYQGGCGAVAMLVGPDAAIVFDRKVRSTHMTHVYDFYKPDMSSEYPTVDGHLSIRCYKEALDKCYQLYMNKTNKQANNNISLDSFDGVLFHAPYCKLVQKSMARLYLLNYLQMAKNNMKSFKCEKELDIYK
jgi:hydroxymethylglutaryl-CoA synthase